MIDFRSMMGSTSNPYMVVDRELRFLWANEAYERATMRAFADLKGISLFEAFPPPDETTRQQLMDSIHRAFDTGEVDELAFIEYAIENADGSMASRFWSATHTPFRDSSGEVAYVMQHTVDITELETLRRERDAMGVVKRARAAEQRYNDVAQEVAELRSLLEQTPGFVAVLTGAEHRFLFANAAYRRLLGERDLIGQTVANAIPEVAEQGFVAILDEAFASGEPYFGHREKVVFVDDAATDPRETYLEFIFQPIRTDYGQVSGIFVQGHDVTEEVEAGQRQRLLINELNHRVKNTLAVVQGLAQQSFGRNADGSFEVFGARLAALSSAHTLLTASTWEAADLHDLVRGALEATAGFDVRRCALHGPPVTVAPQLALTIAMIVHELSTNAIKYGALSNDSGTIDVRWNIVADGETDRLLLDWNETGGPPVQPPVREGFGTTLIRRSLGAQGRVELRYEPAGLACQIEAIL